MSDLAGRCQDGSLHRASYPVGWQPVTVSNIPNITIENVSHPWRDLKICQDGSYTNTEPVTQWGWRAVKKTHFFAENISNMYVWVSGVSGSVPEKMR